MTLTRRQFLQCAATVAAAYSTRGYSQTHRYKALEALIRDYVAGGKIANGVFGIARGHEAPTFFSFGSLQMHSGAPATPDSLYRLYSMTKPITGMASMLLVEDGKISLDQPLADIFPAFAHMSVLIDPSTSLESRAATRPILIRHLLTHSSGLSYSILRNGPIHQAYLDQGIVTGQVSEADEQTMHRPPTLAALAETVAGLPLLFEPGTRWGYSIGLDIMGAVIEEVTGQSFERFLQRRLLEPLEMYNTMFRVPPYKLARMTTNYEMGSDGPRASDAPPHTIYAHQPALFYGGAGLVSTARDYTRFNAMLLHRGQLGAVRVMRSETARLGMSNLLEPGVTTPAGWGFGAGGRVVLKDEAAGYSAGTYGWDGAFDTLAFVDRAKDLYAVFMTQIPIFAYPLEKQVVAAIYADCGK